MPLDEPLGSTIVTLECTCDDISDLNRDMYVNIEVAGRETDTLTEADFSTQNFFMGELVLGKAPGASSDGRLVVNLTDAKSNQGEAENEALYVGNLQIRSGVTFYIKAPAYRLLPNVYYLNGGAPKQLRMGDANLDGVVDIVDLGIVRGNMDPPLTGAFWSQGDFNGDCVVDELDEDILWANYSILYVNAELSDGADDGSSWGNAFRSNVNGKEPLVRAILASQIGAEIWVAGGTYRPGVPGELNTTYVLVGQAGVRRI